jgi:hypothetical protein
MNPECTEGRLAAPAERRGGFGTCAQSGQHGGQRTPAVPELSSPSTIGKTGPCPTCRSERTTRNGGPEPTKRATIPRAVLPYRDPPARTVPRSGSTSQPRDSSTLPTRIGHLPSDLALSLMPQLHDAMEAGAGRQKFQECVDTHGASSRTRTTRRGHHLPGTARIDAQGLSTRAGDYHPSSAASGRRPRDRPNAWNNDSEGCRNQATRILPTALLPGDGPAREEPSWFRH